MNIFIIIRICLKINEKNNNTLSYNPEFVAQGEIMKGFLKPDIVLVTGDRYEMLSFTIAALFQRIPIAHIHGGEKTIGSFDDSIRHSITKMSNFHFVANKEYKKRR